MFIGYSAADSLIYEISFVGGVPSITEVNLLNNKIRVVDKIPYTVKEFYEAVKSPSVVSSESINARRVTDWNFRNIPD